MKGFHDGEAPMEIFSNNLKDPWANIIKGIIMGASNGGGSRNSVGIRAMVHISF